MKEAPTEPPSKTELALQALHEHMRESMKKLKAMEKDEAGATKLEEIRDQDAASGDPSSQPPQPTSF